MEILCLRKSSSEEKQGFFLPRGHELFFFSFIFYTFFLPTLQKVLQSFRLQLQRKTQYNSRTFFSPNGSFKNYVDKMRWVGGQKMAILVHVQGNKCPRGGRQVVKKGQNHVHVVILNDPLYFFSNIFSRKTKKKTI